MRTRRRLVPLVPGQLDAEQRRLYDSVVSGPRAAHASLVPVVEPDGTLAGPFDPLLRSPAIGTVVQQLGASLRYSSSLTPRERELVTLFVAGRAGNAYEIGAHRRLAEQAGLLADEVEHCAAGLPPVLDEPREGAMIDLTAALLDGPVPPGVADAAMAELGELTLVEVTVLVGYYRLLAGLLDVAGVPAPGHDR